VLSLAREDVGGKDEGFGRIFQVLLVEGFRVFLLGVGCSSIVWRFQEWVLSSVLRVLTGLAGFWNGGLRWCAYVVWILQ
jgi:hypothetical protein